MSRYERLQAEQKAKAEAAAEKEAAEKKRPAPPLPVEEMGLISRRLRFVVV